MTILPVFKYNQQQELKYHAACQAWKPEEGGFPQAAFYFMCTHRGDFRKTGYVAVDDHAVLWERSKYALKRAIASYLMRGY